MVTRKCNITYVTLPPTFHIAGSFFLHINLETFSAWPLFKGILLVMSPCSFFFVVLFTVWNHLVYLYTWYLSTPTKVESFIGTKMCLLVNKIHYCMLGTQNNMWYIVGAHLLNKWLNDYSVWYGSLSFINLFNQRLLTFKTDLKQPLLQEAFLDCSLS